MTEKEGITLTEIVGIVLLVCLSFYVRAARFVMDFFKRKNN